MICLIIPARGPPLQTHQPSRWGVFLRLGRGKFHTHQQPASHQDLSDGGFSFLHQEVGGDLILLEVLSFVKKHEKAEQKGPTAKGPGEFLVVSWLKVAHAKYLIYIYIFFYCRIL